MRGSHDDMTIPPEWREKVLLYHITMNREMIVQRLKRLGDQYFNPGLPFSCGGYSVSLFGLKGHLVHHFVQDFLSAFNISAENIQIILSN